MNLEDLVKEEETIFHILQFLDEHRSISLEKIGHWWVQTDKSSILEMQFFFEEEASKKLIRQQ